VLEKREDVARTLLDALKGVLADLADVEPGGELAFRVLHRIDQSELQGQAGAFSRSVFVEVLKTGKLKISEAALYKKLKQHGLGG
jgi:hypothetical protein